MAGRVSQRRGAQGSWSWDGSSACSWSRSAALPPSLWPWPRPAASGSGLVSSQPGSGVHFAVITQCITLHDEPNIFAEARHQGYGTFTLRLDFTTTFNCTTGFLTWANGAQVQDPVTWKTLRLSGIPPSNANAVLVTLRAEDSEPHGLLVDGVIVASRRAIFLDGFEGNDAGEVAPCRWGGEP